MDYTHTIEIKTPKGEFSAEYIFNGGGKPKIKIISSPELDIQSDKCFHKIMNSIEELYKYSGGLDKLEIIKK